MLIHCRLPPAFYCIFITHLHSWAERGTVRIKCIAKQHNAINQPWCKPKRHHLQSSGLNVKGGKGPERPFYLPHWLLCLPAKCTICTFEIKHFYQLKLFWSGFQPYMLRSLVEAESIFSRLTLHDLILLHYNWFLKVIGMPQDNTHIWIYPWWFLFQLFYKESTFNKLFMMTSAITENVLLQFAGNVWSAFYA